MMMHLFPCDVVSSINAWLDQATFVYLTRAAGVYTVDQGRIREGHRGMCPQSPS